MLAEQGAAVEVMRVMRVMRATQAILEIQALMPHIIAFLLFQAALIPLLLAVHQAVL
jgi:hypothetical protein